MTDEEIARAAAAALEDKKAADVAMYDVRGKSDITDFTIVATGTSAPHLRALIRDVDRALNALGVKSTRQSGEPETGWVVLDYINVIVHVFSEEARAYYNIEQLWTAPAQEA